MKSFLIKNANIINEGQIYQGHVHILGERIKSVFKKEENIVSIENTSQTIDASGKYLIPGIIDDQVHFREPGFPYKGDIHSESRAAVAGGITSFMEMPNTSPQTITQAELEKKFALGSQKSLANYSFYMGATNDNIDELIATDKNNVCGIKVFMGSSTGNMLVDNTETLSKIFKNVKLLIATHCEDTPTITKNTDRYIKQFGQDIPMKFHADIRSKEACYLSSSQAVKLAKKYDTRLHVLHLSTAEELELFDSETHRDNKRISAEVCVHHLWFNKDDYEKYGSKIKWNPSIKDQYHQEALLYGLLSNKIDVIATDHAPHSISEKEGNYFHAMSGGPLVQHSLVVMIELYRQGKISLEQIVDKMCHAPADVFKIKERGYIRPNFYADLALVDLDQNWKVNKSNLLYKCGWSPFEGQTFSSGVSHTFINGQLIYENGRFNETTKGKALQFNR